MRQLPSIRRRNMSVLKCRYQYFECRTIGQNGVLRHKDNYIGVGQSMHTELTRRAMIELVAGYDVNLGARLSEKILGNITR